MCNENANVMLGGGPTFFFLQMLHMKETRWSLFIFRLKFMSCFVGRYGIIKSFHHTFCSNSSVLIFSHLLRIVSHSVSKPHPISFRAVSFCFVPFRAVSHIHTYIQSDSLDANCSNTHTGRQWTTTTLP